MLVVLEPRQLRIIINQLMSTSSELDAFIIDYFPETYKHFSGGLDRTARLNILLVRERHAALCEALTKAYPEFMGLLSKDSPTSISKKLPIIMGLSIIVALALLGLYKSIFLDKTTKVLDRLLANNQDTLKIVDKLALNTEKTAEASSKLVVLSAEMMIRQNNAEASIILERKEMWTPKLVTPVIDKYSRYIEAVAELLDALPNGRAHGFCAETLATIQQYEQNFANLTDRREILRYQESIHEPVSGRMPKRDSAAIPLDTEKVNVRTIPTYVADRCRLVRTLCSPYHKYMNKADSILKRCEDERYPYSFYYHDNIQTGCDELATSCLVIYH